MYVSVALVMVLLSVVQFVPSLVRWRVYVYDAGTGEPRLDGMAHRNTTEALPGVALKLVGAEEVVDAVAWGTETVTRLPDTGRASTVAVVELTAVIAVTANVDVETPADGETVTDSPPPYTLYNRQKAVADGQVVVTAVVVVHAV